jgi:hypothetical protein
MPVFAEKSRPAQLARTGVLLFLFALSALAECRKMTALDGADVWWRIRTGQWILQKHALPHSALFSRAAELPWTASGWCTDVLIAVVYRMAGIAALPLFVIAMRCGLAVLLFLLAGGRDDKKWLAAGILAGFALWMIGAPACGPAAVSAAFYGVELLLLLRLQRGDPVRLLYALPVFFFIWANLAPEFLCGLLLLLIFLVADAMQRWAPALQSGERSEMPLENISIATAACFAAPCLAPYSYHLYPNFFAELYSNASFKYVPNMHALGFRQPRDFFLALFVLGVFFVLGRRRNLFLTFASVATVPIVFRIQRDSWLAVLPATAAFALLWHRDRQENEASSCEIWIAALLSTIVVIAGAIAQLAPAKLQARIAEHSPAQAASYIATHKVTGPLFELSRWGGYVIFSLPDYPVPMDSRMVIYGDDAYDQEQKLTGGEVPLESVPSFSESRTLLLPVDSALAQAIMNMPQFRDRYRVLYKDSVAVVIEAPKPLLP